MSLLCLLRRTDWVCPSAPGQLCHVSPVPSVLGYSGLSVYLISDPLPAGVMMLLKLPVFHVVLNILRHRKKQGKPEHLNLIITISFACLSPSSGHMPRWLYRASSPFSLARQIVEVGCAEPPALESGRFSSRATRFFGPRNPLGNCQCSSVWLHPGAAQRRALRPPHSEGARLREM